MNLSISVSVPWIITDDDVSIQTTSISYLQVVEKSGGWIVEAVLVGVLKSKLPVTIPFPDKAGASAAKAKLMEEIIG